MRNGTILLLGLTKNIASTNRIFFFSDRFYWDAWDPNHLTEACYAVGNVLNFTRLFYLLVINDHLGPLLISLERMIKVNIVSGFKVVKRV